MGTTPVLKQRVRHLKCSRLLQGTNEDMPTEASWAFVREVPNMGSMMEQLRVNLEVADEGLAEYKYVRVLQQNIYTRK